MFKTRALSESTVQVQLIALLSGKDESCCRSRRKRNLTVPREEEEEEEDFRSSLDWCKVSPSGYSGLVYAEEIVCFVLNVSIMYKFYL